MFATVRRHHLNEWDLQGTLSLEPAFLATKVAIWWHFRSNVKRLTRDPSISSAWVVMSEFPDASTAWTARPRFSTGYLNQSDTTFRISRETQPPFSSKATLVERTWFSTGDSRTETLSTWTDHQIAPSLKSTDERNKWRRMKLLTLYMWIQTVEFLASWAAGTGLRWIHRWALSTLLRMTFSENLKYIDSICLVAVFFKASRTRGTAQNQMEKSEMIFKRKCESTVQ